MITVNIYRKKFSQIGKIQDEEEIFYNLTTTEAEGKMLYGIELVSQKCGQKSISPHCDIADSEVLVKNLLKYLYENAVKLESSRDIIKDVRTTALDFISA